MTIEQTIEIPNSRRIILDLPQELPIGRAKVELSITPETTPKPKIEDNGKIRLTKAMIDEILSDETVRSLTGILHTEMSLEEIREERLAKYLK